MKKFMEAHKVGLKRTLIGLGIVGAATIVVTIINRNRDENEESYEVEAPIDVTFEPVISEQE